MGVNIISNNPGRAISALNGDEPPSDWGRRESRAWRWAAGAVALMLVWAYAPNFRELTWTWSLDPNYSHGFLVVPIALFILWRRLSDQPDRLDQPLEPPSVAVSAPLWGCALLAAILGVRVFAYEYYFQWVETATLLPAAACLIWILGGWPLLRRAWPAILFLVFMLPLPRAINGLVALPLQWIAATGSGFLLQLSGLWVIQEGNVINVSTPVGIQKLDVALACNGLKMLMCLAATVTATIMLIDLPPWKRIALLISAVPIAMISNMIRIVSTGWAYYLIAWFIPGGGDKQIKLRESYQEWAHDVSGWFMMPLALVLVGLELSLLAWLVPEDEEPEDDRQKELIRRLVEGPKAEKPAAPGKAAHQDLAEL
jgi:exosortase